MDRNALILNAGSSSLKWVVLHVASEAVIDSGTATWPAGEGSRHQHEIQAALDRVRDIAAVGHRVVHGGLRYRQAVRVDDQVRAGIAELSQLAPLHNPAALAGIEAVRMAWPALPQVACFDTAFHATLPEAAATYAVPWDWTEHHGVRRFGFHGLSVQYATQRVAELLGTMPRRMLVCHLGAGCSVTALAEGRSVDTSMGFTPLEGLMMARRSGSIDPGILLHLLDVRRMPLGAIEHGLNEQSGLLGVSGLSDDMRAVLQAEAAGNPRATLAVAMFLHRLASVLGAMVAVLGGLDALVFTGGIGEHSAEVRRRTVERLAFLDVRLDAAANTGAQSDTELSPPGARVRTVVIAAREDVAIMRDLKRVLGW